MQRVDANDPDNLRLRAQVRPKNWKSNLRSHYDFIAVGGGTAGLVSTAGSAHLGAKTLIVEKNYLGGDCLITGCVPSKALLHAAQVASEINKAAALGIHIEQSRVDFSDVMRRVRERRADIATADSAQAWSLRGVDVAFGEARFTSPNSLEINGETVHFKRALVATGGRPRFPPIPGLASVDALTSDTFFDLVELPKRLVIIGGGPMGCEIAQAMARLGSHVSLIQQHDRLIMSEDKDASKLLDKALRQDGVNVYLSTECTQVTASDDGVVFSLKSEFNSSEIVGDALFVATGRQANVEGLGLDAAGVNYNEEGIQVNSMQRSSNRRIYAAGDVCSQQKFTHAAWAQAEYAVMNAFFPFRYSMQNRFIPHVTFTDPEIARVGLSDEILCSMGDKLDILTVAIDASDRARIEGESVGFARLYLKKGSDKIIAASLVCNNAGEVIAQLGLAIQAGIGLNAIAKTIYAYPTRNELVSRLADTYNLNRVTPTIRRWLQRWFSVLR